MTSHKYSSMSIKQLRLLYKEKLDTLESQGYDVKGFPINPSIEVLAVNLLFLDLKLNQFEFVHRINKSLEVIDNYDG